MEVIARKEAKKLGLRYYFTGVPCKRGHITKRTTSGWNCTECSSINRKNYSKVKKAESDKKYRYNNKESLKIKKKSYYESTKVLKKPLTIKEKEWKKLRAKLSEIVRHRLSKAVNRCGYKKTSSTSDIIGCSWEELKNHLESQFKEGMSWLNHGYYGWHIDHIIPLSSANSKDELYKLGHYTNLQPLWMKENLLKGNKILNKKK